jgi:uncharacterized membrane protein (UPF0127 family)
MGPGTLPPAATGSRGLTKLSLIFFLFLPLYCGCDQQKKPQFLKTAEIAIESSNNGRVILKAELAKTQEEHSQGLMYRRRLADGQGMLFIFDRDDMLSFWMKNTYIPLSIAFISHEGRIMEIRDMRPNDLSPVKSGRSVRYALEVPQGWFGRAKIQAGDMLILDTIR